jgi:hypothetical protein
VSAPRPPLEPGDRIDYSLSFDGGAFWLKMGASSTLREGENPVEAYDRLGGVVDNLLQYHVKTLKDNLKPT